jgi:hypothetical protein
VPPQLRLPLPAAPPALHRTPQSPPAACVIGKIHSLAAPPHCMHHHADKPKTCSHSARVASRRQRGTLSTANLAVAQGSPPRLCCSTRRLAALCPRRRQLLAPRLELWCAGKRDEHAGSSR